MPLGNSNREPREDSWNTPERARYPILGDLQRSDLVGLLAVYAGQAGSYTTLLWQVPALSFTGQSFLLTVALTTVNDRWAGVISAVLSFLIALGSWRLLHQHRGHAINHMVMAGRVSHLLNLKELLGDIDRTDDAISADDAVPLGANAETVWDVDHSIYHLWQYASGAFLIADVVIFAVSVDIHRILPFVPSHF